MKRLAIIGSGDLGKLIADYAINDNHYEVAGFFDDLRKKGEKVDGIKILGNTKEILNLFSKDIFDCIIIAIAYKHFKQRKAFFDIFKNLIPFGKIIHSASFVNLTCKIGDGVVILPGCVIDRNVTIEDNVLLHIGCKIIGGCSIKSHSFFSGNVSVAGFTEIGESCFIGVGATIIDNLLISNNIKIGGGAVVVKNLSEIGWYVGNPAKFLKSY